MGLSSQEMVLFSWEDWGALCLGWCLQPCLTNLVGLLICPAWGELVAWGTLFPSLEGRWAITWEELLPLLEGRRATGLGGIASFPEGRWAIAWEELLPSSKGRWAAAGRELLPSPEGRWARVVLGGMPDAWLLTGVIAWEGLLASLVGRGAPAWLLVWVVLLPSPGGKC